MEREFVAWLLGRIPPDPRLEVPAGDDAAVLTPPAGRNTVVTVDMLMDGVDFRLAAGCPPRAVGHKALGVSLSDLAAMGARPEAAVAAVALPRREGERLGREIHVGLAELARAHGVAIAGGDTNSWDGPLVVSVTALGSVPPGRAWRRCGARPGDLILVSGPCGGSLLGRHLAVEPRCREALWLADRFPVRAAIDISDGLSLDLARMMEASDAATLVDLAAVPIHDDARAAAARPGDTRSPLEHALGDGEDFELLIALPPADARDAVRASTGPPFSNPLTVIGEVIEGSGLWVRGASGGRTALEPRGFLHGFASAEGPS